MGLKKKLLFGTVTVVLFLLVAEVGIALFASREYRDARTYRGVDNSRAISLTPNSASCPNPTWIFSSMLNLRASV